MLANIFDWLIKNKEWLFSGIGISVIAVLFAHGKKFYNRFEPTLKSKACFRCLFITKIISG